MSYCVNCGVKLKSSEKKCPLCKTKVINPNNKLKTYEEIYSNKIENFKNINYKYILKLLTMIFTFISVVVLILNYIISKEITWSAYVIFSIIYLICTFQYILQKNIYLSHILELIGTELFMFIVAILNNGMDWYLYLIAPFIFIAWTHVMLYTILIRSKKPNIFHKISSVLFLDSISLLGIEISIDLYKYNKITFNWSIYASIPITLLALIILYISFNHKLMDEIKQRIFI